MLLHENNLLMTIKQAKFSIGQIIRHKRFDYRGVIIDVDPVFQGSEEWYEQMATSHPPKDQPWYQVLVDDASHQTYVAERNLMDDESNEKINHPSIDDYFSSFNNGSYQQQQH